MSSNLVLIHCQNSHAIAPKYESFSKTYTNVVFTKSDVDKAPDVAQKYSISAMPSFVFIKNGSKVDLVRGADPSGLEAAIKRHSGEAGAPSFSGKGQTLGGGTAAGAAPGAGIGERLGQLDAQSQVFLLLGGV
jgi:thioredoxin 1